MILSLGNGSKADEYVSEDSAIVLGSQEGDNLVVDGEDDIHYIHLGLDKETYDVSADLFNTCYFDVSAEELKGYLRDLEDARNKLFQELLPVFLPALMSGKLPEKARKACNDGLRALTANYAHRVHMRRIIHEKQPLSA